MLSFFRRIILKKHFHYFSLGELVLWSFSVLIIMVSFLIFDRENYLTALSSVLGVTSLIFSAKGNPFGQFLMVIFSLLYGVISYSFSYYGEMITYLGMTAPMALFSLIAWLKNPYKKRRAEVKVNTISTKEFVLMLILTAAVTFIFYFILKHFNTANIVPSTLSVTTSFAAVYLTFRRSPLFAIAYSLNDLVLIFLWSLAARENISYLSVVICFAMFFINDLYGFINWNKMKRAQKNS
ncbi:MAG: nicotinamide mononucleotide transporter [Clostridia bacterium]|nr:nicotinamide mononucleotide transporter [Clostridia bacterium]